MLRPSLEALLKESEKNKQRAAAELLGGIISGMLQFRLVLLYI